MYEDFETHEKLEQTVVFRVEVLSHQMKWVPAETQDFRKDGKFIVYHPEFRELLEEKTVGKDISFEKETKAVNLARVLRHLSDRPLRVLRVQKVRMQRQVGKVFLPTGGI